MQEHGWICCIDFGTALSKCALVATVDREILTQKREYVDLVPLAAGSGGNPYLLPSVIYLSNDRILFGREAEDAAKRTEHDERRAFTSSKQYLSTRDPKELDLPLPKSVDPRGRFTARKLLKLYLAYVLERTKYHMDLEDKPWPVPLRIARPAWDRSRALEAEKTLKELVRGAMALVGKLGSKLSAHGGIAQTTARTALEKLQEDPADDSHFALVNGNATILEATAVASGSIRPLGRRVVAVADIGGGTCDFGAFMTGYGEAPVIAEVRESSHILRDAGDFLDMLLRRLILSKAGILEDSPAGAGVSNRLRVHERRNKEDLFRDKKISIEINDTYLDVTLEELLNIEHTIKFAERLKSEFHKTLTCAVNCAKHWPQLDGGRTKVEILLTGGGHQLPMVRDLIEKPSVMWEYTTPAPDLIERPEELEFASVAGQLTVAIGGAIRDLPKLTAPIG
jgi:hypothetical protein